MRLAAAFLGVAKWAPTRLHGVELFWCVAPVALIPEPPAAGQGVGSSGVGLRHLGFLFFVSATADFDKPLKLRIHRVRRAARQGQGARHRHICASCSTKDYRRRECGGLYVASQNEELLCPEAVLVTCHCPQELPGDLVKMQSHIQWVWSGG